MRTLKILLRLATCAFTLSTPANLPAQVSQTADSPPARPARLPDMMQTHGRVAIAKPATPLHLGEDNALALILKGPPATKFFSIQATVNANGVRSPWIEGGDTVVTLQHKPDGQPYINFVPLALGRLEIRVNVFFSDGGIDQASTIVDVVAAAPPTELKYEFSGGSTSVLRLDLSEQGRRGFLRIRATYAGVKNALPIETDKAQFQLTMSQEAPPIKFDPKTLQIDALHTGHALIETHYAGLSLTTCVQVGETHYGYDSSGCRDALMSVGAASEIPGGRARSYKSELPYGPTDTRTGRYLADDRVDLVAPTQPLHIAQDNPITFQLHGPAIARIDCHPAAGDVPCEAWKGQWSHMGMPFTPNPDGTATLNLFPAKFGKNEYTFTVLFVDGGVALKKLTVEVDAGNARPKSIEQWCDRENPEKDLPVELVPPTNGREDFRGKSTLAAGICYDGLRSAASLPAAAANYQLHTEEKQPPVELDPATGIVKAIRPGQALIQQTFAGLTLSTCVVVAQLDEPNASNCRQMRVRYGASLPPLKVQVRPPAMADEPERPAAGTGVIGGAMGSIGSAPAVPVVDAITGARLSPGVRDRFNADARFTVLTTGLVAELGQPTRLPVRITGPEVLSVNIDQELVRYNAKLGPIPYEEPAYEEVHNGNRIGRDPDGSPYLHILPLRTGTSKFRISVLFADGGVATRLVRLPVKLPARLPPHLANGLDDSIRDSRFEATTLHLTITPPTGRNLFPFLLFDGAIKRIALSPADVRFSLKYDGTDPVVRVDAKTGTVTALRTGHALITARYASAESETCIVVVDDFAQSDLSTCQELRGSGSSTGRSTPSPAPAPRTRESSPPTASAPRAASPSVPTRAVPVL